MRLSTELFGHRRSHALEVTFVVLTLVSLGLVGCPALAAVDASRAYAPRASTGTTPDVAPQRRFNVFGYLPEYRQRADFPYEAVFQQGLTHLIFFSVEVDRSTGVFNPLAYQDRLPQGDQWRYVRELADAYGVKLMVCVGGGGRSDGFPALLRDESGRRAFVHTLNDWALSKELDGVDFNWEYPQSEMEWMHFGQLLREVRSTLGYASLPVPDGSTAATPLINMTQADRTRYWQQHRLTPAQLARSSGVGAHEDKSGPRRRAHVRELCLSLALHPHPSLGPVLQHHGILQSVDYLHWMSYDSPLQGRPHSGVDYAEATLSPPFLDALSDSIFYAPRPLSPLHAPGKAVPSGPAVKVDHRKKITLGIPFYGRVTNNLAAPPETYERLAYFIRQWVRKTHPEWQPDGQELRGMNDYGGYNFNSYHDVQRKMQLARGLTLLNRSINPDEVLSAETQQHAETGIAGIMIWELGQDVQPPSTQPLSLMRAVGDQLRLWAGAEPYEAFTVSVAPPTAPTAEATTKKSGGDDSGDDGGDL